MTTVSNLSEPSNSLVRSFSRKATRQFCLARSVRPSREAATCFRGASTFTRSSRLRPP